MFFLNYLVWEYANNVINTLFDRIGKIKKYYKLIGNFQLSVCCVCVYIIKLKWIFHKNRAVSMKYLLNKVPCHNLEIINVLVVELISAMLPYLRILKISIMAK
jgi:hypothetical protein